MNRAEERAGPEDGRRADCFIVLTRNGAENSNHFAPVAECPLCTDRPVNCAARFQMPNIFLGSGPSEYQAARSYAALYVPYAMMATAAYSDPAVLNAEHCPDPAKLVNRALAKDEADFTFHKNVHAWIANLQVRKWECRFGVVGSLSCPLRNPQCKLIGGLEFHIWRRVDNGCREVAIAFRGTDRNDLGDWQSNFRWLHRLAPRFDQYDQVRENIGMIVRRIEAAGCSSPSVRFVAVGHSLGGGLAEQVGYAHPKIRYVYAFDPSPVTGFFDVSALLR